MQIEVSGDIQYIEVLETAIRYLPYQGCDGEPSELLPHFQARFKIDEAAKDHWYGCEVSYYDK